MKILAIGAHPADVFDLGGGTLGNFAQEGHEVYMAVMTHGAYSHTQAIAGDGEEQTQEAFISLKREECEKAAQCIGMKEVRYLDFDDEPFLPTREMIHALAVYVREVRPDIVITHHPREYGHPDHPVVGDAALRALKAAERRIEGCPLPPHPMKQVYFFATQFRAICSQLGSVPVPATFIVDIERSIERKIQALSVFNSQSFKGARYDETWTRLRIDRLEGYWGFMAGLRYAEEFTALLPQTVSLLP